MHILIFNGVGKLFLDWHDGFFEEKIVRVMVIYEYGDSLTVCYLFFNRVSRKGFRLYFSKLTLLGLFRIILK